jgi:CubicO group peptidase (beta-lactamase class C family)
MSGLPSHNFAFEAGLTPSDWLTNLPHLKTLNPLGAQFEYSNVNYVIASAIIESLTNQSFTEAVDSLIFEPLGINITWNAIDAEERGNRSQGFRKYGLDVEACNSPDGGLEACGIQEGFDYWTRGSGEEFAGAASALMSGLDMVSHSSDSFT